MWLYLNDPMRSQQVETCQVYHGGGVGWFAVYSMPNINGMLLSHRHCALNLTVCYCLTDTVL